jgi:uncharacterized protein YhaN
MNRIKNTALVLCGFAMGAALVLLFKKGDSSIASTNSISPKSVEALFQQTLKKENQLQLLIDEMNKKNAGLDTALVSLNARLQTAKTKNRQLQKDVIRLTKKKTVNDTAALLADCDTLKTTVVLLNRAADEKDRLYDGVIANQQQQLTQKDSTIQLHRLQYTSLKNSFSESIAQQKLLVDQNNLFKKQLRKQRVKSKILSGLTIIAAGITTHFLLK